MLPRAMVTKDISASEASYSSLFKEVEKNRVLELDVVWHDVLSTGSDLV